MTSAKIMGKENLFNNFGKSFIYTFIKTKPRNYSYLEKYIFRS